MRNEWFNSARRSKCWWVRPFSASRCSSAMAARVAAAGSGPSVPALKYASRSRTGKLAAQSGSVQLCGGGHES